MRIAMVKKVLANGRDCSRCRSVQQKLQKAGYLDCIGRILIADERDIGSAGWLAAMQYGVEQAPFFIVSHDDGHDQVITDYAQLLQVIEQNQNGVQQRRRL